MAMKTVLVFLIATILASLVAEGVTLNIVYVNGTLYCTSTGSRGANANTPIFPGARVEVVCQPNVISNSPANATTDSNGMYRVMLLPRRNTTIDSIVSGCKIFVLTPLSTCNPTLPSAGLVSNLSFVKSILVQFVYLTYLVASGFMPQP